MADLTASARVALAAPQAAMATLCARFSAFGEVKIEGCRGRIDTVFGTAHLRADACCLCLRAEGADETALAYVKLSLAEHLLRLSADERPRIVWSGDGAAGAPLPYFREMTVTAARRITPRMRRVTLAGQNLARFTRGGHHVRLLLPAAAGQSPVWPVTGEDGRPSWPAGAERPAARIYTIRRIDVAAGEVDIDFVLHEGDHPGTRFAREARTGDRVGMTGPGGGPAPRADWLLLAGDETALPAIARMLEALPAGAHAVVRVEVADMEERQPLASAARLDIGWLPRHGAAPGTTMLLEDAVRAVRWPGGETSTYAWAGCEHAAFRAIRAFLRTERGLAPKDHLAAAYWRRGATGEG